MPEEGINCIFEPEVGGELGLSSEDVRDSEPCDEEYF